jgi:hypothetical protein
MNNRYFTYITFVTVRCTFYSLLLSVTTKILLLCSS